MSRCFLVALVLLCACDLCKPTPPPTGTCTSDADCQPGFACLAGTCQSLSAVLQDLSAVVTPPEGTLAPQQFQGRDGTQASLTLILGPPQLWDLQIPVPPTCTAEQALPMTLRFTPVGSLIPLLDWTFTFTTDIAGNVHGALPAPEQFNEWIVPATPCVAPLAENNINSNPGIAPQPVFADTSSTIMVVGAISVAGSSGTYRCPVGQRCTFGGASVTIKSSLGQTLASSFFGQPVSATVTSIGGPAGTSGFELPVPSTQVAPSNACAPQPVDVTCDGGICPTADSCAQLLLEVGPSPENPQLPLPTIDLPIVARYATPPFIDGGVAAGPILSLLGEDGLGVELPIGPTQLVTASCTVTQPGDEPGGVPLQSAEVTIACVQSDGGSLCPQGYSYRETTLTGINGSGPGGFQLSVPPNASYALTATPPPGLGLAPVSQLLPVHAVGIFDAGLFVPPDYLLTGTVLDPTSSVPITAGQVQATSLTTGALVGATELGSGGGFQLSLPPGQYMLTIRPASSTGLPNFSVAEALVGDVDLGNISLYLPGRLTGSVFAEPLDGGPYPVAQASVDFYFVTENQAFGKVAVPIASGITDQEGHFSVAVPASN